MRTGSATKRNDSLVATCEIGFEIQVRHSTDRYHVQLHGRIGNSPNVQSFWPTRKDSAHQSYMRNVVVQHSNIRRVAVRHSNIKKVAAYQS